MISFSTPCLRWKLVGARKLQFGWPGFIAPYRTRYLNKHVVLTSIPSAGYGTPSQAPPTISTQDFFFDHLGNVTYDPNPVDAEADFPYGTTLTEDPGASETWTVTETYFKHVYNNGYIVLTTEVTLSNEYTIDQLNADLDALIAAVNVDAAPWNGITVNLPNDLGSAPTDPNVLIPAQYNYAEFFRPGFQGPVTLRAAAYSACHADLVSGIWYPNAAVKVVGHIAMAGDYCLNTFFIDDSQKLLDQVCRSGTGSCSGAFTVTPPPAEFDDSAYIVLTPNCQC